MKKIAYVLLAFCLSLCLFVGCSSGPSAQQMKFTTLHSPYLKLSTSEEEFVKTDDLTKVGDGSYEKDEPVEIDGISCKVLYQFTDGSFTMMNYYTIDPNTLKDDYAKIVSYLKEIYGSPETEEEEKTVWKLKSEDNVNYQIFVSVGSSKEYVYFGFAC